MQSPKRRNATRRRTGGIARSGGMGATNITVPYERAIQVRQQRAMRDNIVTAQELVGNITLEPANNNVFELDINPLLFEGTRLQSLCKSYQQYKFTKLSFRIMTNLPTTVGGTITSGFSTNPDLTVSRNRVEAQREIFALPGSQISNMWVHATVNCALNRQGGENVWYTIDADSPELMKTTQGKLFLLPSGELNITQPIAVPLIMTYSVVFRGSANLAGEIPDVEGKQLPIDMYYFVSNIAGYTGPTYVSTSEANLSGDELAYYRAFYAWLAPLISKGSVTFKCYPPNFLADYGDMYTMEAVHAENNQYIVWRGYDAQGRALDTKANPGKEIGVQTSEVFIYPVTSSVSSISRLLNRVNLNDQKSMITVRGIY